MKKLKLKSILKDYGITERIAVVYDEYNVAVKPMMLNSPFYEFADDTEYWVICARHSYILNTKDNSIIRYNYK